MTCAELGQVKGCTADEGKHTHEEPWHWWTPFRGNIGTGGMRTKQKDTDKPRRNTSCQELVEVRGELLAKPFDATAQPEKKKKKKGTDGQMQTTNQTFQMQVLASLPPAHANGRKSLTPYHAWAPRNRPRSMLTMTNDNRRKSSREIGR